VLLRADINASVDDEGKPIPNARFAEVKEGIETLNRYGARTVVMLHQGRNGAANLITHGPIADRLRQMGLDELIYRGNTLDLEKDALSAKALKWIAGMENGQTLMLDNMRLLRGEQKSRSPEEYAQDLFCRQLMGEEGGTRMDVFVLGDLSVAHRADRSVIGFPEIPNLAGRTLVRELGFVDDVLRHFENPQEYRILVLGGIKAGEYIKFLQALAEKEMVDKVLTGGMLANLILYVQMGEQLGKATIEAMSRVRDKKEKSILDYADAMSNLLAAHPKLFVTPGHVAYYVDGRRREYPVGRVPRDVRENHPIQDIAERDAIEYAKRIQDSDFTLLKGLLGNYEFKNGSGHLFRVGSLRVLDALKGGRDMVAGGDSSAEVKGKVRKSLAGGAFLEAIVNRQGLPGVRAVETSYEQFSGQMDAYLGRN